MASNVLERPALGEVASIGTLYDARTDSFLGLSLFNGLPPDAVELTLAPSTVSDLSNSDSYEHKSRLLGISNDLAASIITGLTKVGGCGAYLTHQFRPSQARHLSTACRITTVVEELDLSAKDLRKSLAPTSLDCGTATHVVIGIKWGAHYVISGESKSDAPQAGKGDGLPDALEA